MIEKYLLERVQILTDIIKNNKEKYEHNQIAIVESNNQIKELSQSVDEASEIFSVKAREDSGFKKKEVNDIEKRIAAYVVENTEYNKKVENAENELNRVKQCLNKLKDINVSRETFYNDIVKEDCKNDSAEVIADNYEKSINTNKILNKLRFCKSIAEVDGKRVSIEIDNIITELEQ